VALASADNPASSALGSFKEGSSAYRHCRQCLGTSQETTAEVTSNVGYHLCIYISLMPHFVFFQFEESKYQLQSLSEHLHHCEEIETEGGGASQLYGVNYRSVLLDLHYFDLCSGALLPDVMHDVLKGKQPQTSSTTGEYYMFNFFMQASSNMRPNFF